ncbi:hypothetical protein [Streptomyces wuyuanensis]|uniref:hypothetical protein n=1 Tax=Streptomyces wuyuanensis TaxID=1196353 RepID=UPI00343915B7
MAPHDIRFTTAAGHFAAYQDHFRGLYEQGRAPAPLTQLYERHAVHAQVADTGR